jgi:flavin reductase (DIM6/NTAB) family NADH-FMN oxidoreductase RutF
MITLDLASMPHADAYKLAVGSVVPRPIAFVASRSAAGVDNLAPFSFFTVACANPLTLVFSTMRKGPQGVKKDTLANIEETGEYVIHVVDEGFVEKMNMCAAEVQPDVSEFDLSCLTPVPADVVKASRVLESPIAFECKLNQVVEVSARPGGGSLIIGTVLRAHVRDDLYQNGRILLEGWRPVGRLAGAGYCRVTDLFELERP